MKPVLFYTVGYPGAGKTTLARALSTWLDAAHIRGDVIGLELFKFPRYTAEERQMVYAEMDAQTTAHLRAGRHVLYDAAANTRSLRIHLAKLAALQGCRAVGLWVQVPTPLAQERAGTARDRGISTVVRLIPPHIFAQYVAAFEQPQPPEPIITLSGTAPFYLQYRRIYRSLHPQVQLPTIF